MEHTKQLLLQALKAALECRSVDWETPLTGEEWAALFRGAERHHILPMIYEAVHACPAAEWAPAAVLQESKHRTMQQVLLQTMKNHAFLTLYADLAAHGCSPVAVKGILCRSLYPKPEERLSGDEDLLLAPQELAGFDALMKERNMICRQEAGNPLPVHTYAQSKGPLTIEAHADLFDEEDPVCGCLNPYFRAAVANGTEIRVEGVALRTLNPTDHLLYLICHAFKHFLRSGFGIRQVCDMILLANAYGGEVDWMRLMEQLKPLRAEVFAAAIFKIGENHLNFHPEQARYPDFWRAISVDEGPLLEDLLDSGVFGSATGGRLHSSTVTLNAVAADRRGKRAKANPVKSLFPGAKSLQGRYPYLSRRPYLLPVAWVSRIWGYARETAAGEGSSSTAESLKIADQRIDLFRKYRIIN